MKRYRLEFEYLSPFGDGWSKASKEVNEDKYEELVTQYINQLAMPDVRNSKIYWQTVPEWQEFDI